MWRAMLSVGAALCVHRTTASVYIGNGYERKISELQDSMQGLAEHSKRGWRQHTYGTSCCLQHLSMYNVNKFSLAHWSCETFSRRIQRTINIKIHLFAHCLETISIFSEWVYTTYQYSQNMIVFMKRICSGRMRSTYCVKWTIHITHLKLYLKQANH